MLSSQTLAMNTQAGGSIDFSASRSGELATGNNAPNLAPRALPMIWPMIMGPTTHLGYGNWGWK